MNNCKVCVLGATFNTQNMGVSALTAGIIKCLIRQYPDAEISFLDYGKESTISNFALGHKNVKLRLINVRFSKKIFLSNNIAVLLLISILLKLIPSKYFKEKLIQTNLYLKHISESSLAVSIAGGDSFSDIYGLSRFFYISLPQLLVLLMGKELWLLPQTIGPFKRSTAKFIARYIMNRARFVYSRDHAGLREIKAMPGLDKKPDRFRFCYDLGFVLDPVRPATIDLMGLKPEGQTDRTIVGLNVSGLLYIGGYNQKNMFGLRFDYGKLVYEIINYLITRKSVCILLVPHVFGSDNHKESDAVACKKIFYDLKDKYGHNIACVNGTYNQNEIKHIIGMCHFFIGSRMHACIAALSQAIPTVSIAYSKKFIGVMETIDVESLVADPRTLSIDDIISVIDTAFERRASIRNHLEVKIPRVKETILNLFQEIEIACPR